MIEPHNDDFDWNGESVVLQRQDPLAVYTNQHGDIVLRCWQWPDDDVTIIIDQAHAERVAAAILAAAGRPDINWAMANADFDRFEANQQTKDRTAAERQKRWREKHRNGETVTHNAQLPLRDAEA